MTEALVVLIALACGIIAWLWQRTRELDNLKSEHGRSRGTRRSSPSWKPGSPRSARTYNKSVSTLESRVLVSARRLRDLKAAPEDTEIEAIEPVERTARGLQAAALISPSSDRSEAA